MKDKELQEKIERILDEKISVGLVGGVSIIGIANAANQCVKVAQAHYANKADEGITDFLKWFNSRCSLNARLPLSIIDDYKKSLPSHPKTK